SLTGPTQFKFGHSLHRVKCEYIRGTTVMPSGQEKRRGTFTEIYVVPYSLIVFYGVVNEKAAQTTRLSEEDLEAMFKALWVGHKACTDVLTRSKLGHEPRLLLDIVYKPETLTHMGELDKLVRLESSKADEEIRDITDCVVVLDPLVERVRHYRNKIAAVRYKLGDRIAIRPSLAEAFGDLLQPFPWSDEV
ncbi:MAG: type I CRISPR-associated protein Cas7, partial [Candidatus Bipolaricaulota bacterium]|nr:type I CRISPR-associated protein Cas7 [Candidatus Bipolaricaulota bacterium]MDW8127339.1 type I CRISPR-associated protein Cas7 [Candidatus Bipolaricaulota bacterium]